MSNSDSLPGAIEHLTQREKDLVDELNQVRNAIRTLKRAAGVEVDPEGGSSTETFSSPVTDVTRTSTTNNGGSRPTIRPDDFFGVTHAEAARRYLKRVGHAVSFGELVEVLRKGGCKLTSSDPEKVLWISLIKNSRDFVPPQAGYVGLKEFYPARVRAVSERKPAKTKRSTRKKNAVSKRIQKPKSEAKPAEDASPKKANGAEPQQQTQVNEPKQIPLAVHEFMGDKQFHSGDEIVAAVRKKLGHPVKVVSVHGALSGKLFERNDEGMYRMKPAH